MPKLKQKAYMDFHFNAKDWEKIELMHEVLQVSILTYSF